MTATTPVLAIPYPEPTDRVTDGDLTIKAMAEKLELLLDRTAWAAPTLANGWVDFGGGYQTMRYRRIGGVVHLQGAIKNGTVTAGTDLFTLPAGFRPTATNLFLIGKSTGLAVTTGAVNSAGVVFLNVAGDASFMWIDAHIVL